MDGSTTAGTARWPRASALLLVGALITFSACPGPDPREPADALQNLVLISIDTARADRFGVYGASGDPTPHVDALARDGTVFDHAVAPVPFTQPSHATMFTGASPLRHGLRSNTGYRLGDGQSTLAEILRAEGFATHAIVATEVLDPMFGFDQGFDTYDAGTKRARPNGDRVYQARSADEIAGAANAILEGRAESPFFLFLHFYDAHTPRRPPEPYRSRFPEDPYQAELAYVDSAIGRVLAKLATLGIEDSTAVLLTSDHGEALGGHGEETHGYFLYQDTLRIPLIVHVPGWPAAPRVERVVGLVDLVPTVLELFGIDAATETDGTSLVADLRGERREAPPSSVYAEAFEPTVYGRAPIFALVEDRWKYIHTTRPELYDLQTDPGETRNEIERATAIADRLEREIRERVQARSPRDASADRAAPLDPESEASLRALGYVTGVAIDEKIDLDTAKPDPKDFVPAYLDMMEAQSAIAERRLDEAEVLLDGVLAEHPDLAIAHFNLGKIAIRRGDWNEAIEHLERRLALAPAPTAPAADASGIQRPGTPPQFLWELAELHDLLGFAYAATGRFDQAEAHFRRSLSLYPDHVERRVHLADTLYATGSSHAAEAYRHVLELEPDHAKAKARLAILAARAEGGADADAAARH